MSEGDRQITQPPAGESGDLANLGDLIQRYGQPLYQMYLRDREEEREVQKHRLVVEAQADRDWHEIAVMRSKADHDYRLEEMRWVFVLALVFVGLGTVLALEGQPTIGYALISFVVGAGGGYGVGRSRRSEVPASLQAQAE